MELKTATKNDFDRLKAFYRDAILHTENIGIYAKWVYGQHPTDEMILSISLDTFSTQNAK